MGTTLGTAYVQIVPSAQGIKGSISKVLGGEAKSAGETSGKSIGSNIVSFAKKAIVAGAIGKTVMSALNEGAALQQSYIGGLDTLYGDAADAVRNYAKAAAGAGISMNTYSEQAVSFGASLKQAFGGDAVKAAEAANTAILDMADNSAKMGTDIESIQLAYQGFAKQNYTMLDNLKLGYGGTKTEMQRLLSDAEELTGKEYNIDNLGDVYEAIHVIQGELGLTGVAADEAATTFSGSFNAMKAAAQNFLGSLTLGEGVGEAMSQLMTSASTFFFGNFLPMIGNLFASLPEAIGAAISTALPLITEQAGNLVTALANGINTKVPELAAKLPAAILMALNNISTVLPQVAAKGMELLQGLGQAIIANAPVLAAAAAEAIKAFVGYLGANLPNLAAKGGELIGYLAKGIITHLPQILGAVIQIGAFIARTLGSLAGTMVKSGLSLVKGIARGLTSGIGSAIKGAMNRIKEAISKPIEEAKEKVRSILDKIKGFFPVSIGNVVTGLKLPHFSISGSFSLNPPSVPHFSISWYRKAMGEPYMFSNPTLFGAGEAGDEVLYGRKALMRDIEAATSGNSGTQITNYITIDGSASPMETADAIVRQMKLELRTI